MNLTFHWSYYILIAILLIALYTDITKNKIYNWLTFSSLFLALIFSFFNGVGILYSFFGFLMAFAVSLFIYATGGVKGGDVKIMASLGAWFGIYSILPVLLYIFISGGLLGIFSTLRNGTFFKTFNKIKMFFVAAFTPGMKAGLELKESVNKPVPYGIAIFIGTIICLLYPDLITDLLPKINAGK